MEAFDSDPVFSDDHIDNIFIEGSLRDNSLSSSMMFAGEQSKITVSVQFQRVCDTNFYGVDCLTRCIAADNDVDGHYTCDSQNGSRICLSGYSNPISNCIESELIK